MRLNAPKKITWLVAVVVGVVGIVGSFDFVKIIDITIAFWLVVVAFAILALATYLKGL